MARSPAIKQIALPNNWEPREYQRDLWNYLYNGGLRADIAAHRRWGKDDIALHFAAVKSQEKVGTYWHMLPEASQARKAIWDAINPHTGKRRIDEAFPHVLRANTRNNEMFIKFKNGSTWQVVGSDNYNSLVGSPPVGVVFSEWSLARPESWTYMRPILAENGGWALFIWTPRGRNHAVLAWEARSKDKINWYTVRSAATDTDVFTAEQLEREKSELINELGSAEEGNAKFNQEYMVDFNTSTPGSYYGTLITDAERGDRITSVPYDPALQVYTAWDLGIDDYTAIWFFQQVGREVRAIDYYEINGVGLNTIVRNAIFPEKGIRSTYLYASHYLPHDVMVRELSSGKSRYDTLLGLGLRNIITGVATDPEERINAARNLIPITYFDMERCALGINRLRAYRKKWNKALAAFTGPLHDDNSHGSDAFGEFALGRRVVSNIKKPNDRVPHEFMGEGSWMV